MIGSSKNGKLFRESAGGVSRQGNIPNSSDGSGAEERGSFSCVGSGGISRYRKFEVPGRPGNRVVPRYI